MIETARYTVDRLVCGKYRLIFDGFFRGLFATERLAVERAEEL